MPISFPFVTHIGCREVGQNEDLRAVFCNVFIESLEGALIMKTKLSKLSRNGKSFKPGQSITK